MEAFRFGLSIPYIQNRASEMSRKLLDIPVNSRKSIVCRKRKRYRRRPVPVPVSKPRVFKLYQPPPVFSIELDNMFEVLDI